MKSSLKIQKSPMLEVAGDREADKANVRATAEIAKTFAKMVLEAGCEREKAG
jgi:hypothetical protein